MRDPERSAKQAVCTRHVIALPDGTTDGGEIAADLRHVDEPADPLAGTLLAPDDPP